MVLRADHSPSGCSVWSRFKILRAPQPYRLCSASISSIVACGVAFGDDNGAGRCSSNPRTPSASHRSRHLYPVFRLMPYRCQRSVIVHCPLAKS